MKSALFAAALLLGSTASAGIHKLKLKKVPLSEQLVSISDPFGNSRKPS